MKKILSFAFPLLVSIPTLVYADVGASTGLENPLSTNSVEGLMTLLMDIVVRIGAVVSVFALIYVGYLFVEAMGKPEKIKTARKAFLYTVIGIAILVGAKVITVLIENTINYLK